MIVRRRRLCIAALSCAGLTAAIWVFALANSLSIHDIARITSGMKRDEVITAFGRQPDNSGPGMPGHSYADDCWRVIDGLILVFYNDKDEVIGRSGFPQPLLTW